ncbi:MAG: SDR family oxidoreductase [Bacilli bacterium]|nr:SDR family oxidoreductase [Bacilli bacterium]
MPKLGKYGGTYAHKDIAFEFASAISPVFKLYLIKEFERLKDIENQNREWDVKRILTKNNYLIHTDAIKNYILPDNDYYKNKEWLKYAEEADILNVALFNTTAKKVSKNNKVIIADCKNIDNNFIKNNFDNYENVYFFKCDISKKEDILTLKQYVLNNFKKLDCLVCCAGIMPLSCSIDDIIAKNVDRTIDVNLKGTFKSLDILGNFIKETSKIGSIVTISSVDGLIGEPYGVIYSTTKAGIISLTKSFARYFKGDIRVNCVAPELIDKPLTDSTG